MWHVVFTKQAAKDAKKLKTAGLEKKGKQLVEVVRVNPFATPPPLRALSAASKGSIHDASPCSTALSTPSMPHLSPLTASNSRVRSRSFGWGRIAKESGRVTISVYLLQS